MERLSMRLLLIWRFYECFSWMRGEQTVLHTAMKLTSAWITFAFGFKLTWWTLRHTKKEKKGERSELALKANFVLSNTRKMSHEKAFSAFSAASLSKMCKWIKRFGFFVPSSYLILNCNWEPIVLRVTGFAVSGYFECSVCTRTLARRKYGTKPPSGDDQCLQQWPLSTPTCRAGLGADWHHQPAVVHLKACRNSLPAPTGTSSQTLRRIGEAISVSNDAKQHF